MQYTLRNVPELVDQALRRQASEEGVSLNQAALRALARGVGVAEDSPPRRHVADLAGSWIEDPEFDRAIADQDRVDEELWR